MFSECQESKINTGFHLKCLNQVICIYKQHYAVVVCFWKKKRYFAERYLYLQTSYLLKKQWVLLLAPPTFQNTHSIAHDKLYWTTLKATREQPLVQVIESFRSVK